MANSIHPAEDYAYYLDYSRAPVAVVHETVLERILDVLPSARYLKSLLAVRDGGSVPEAPAAAGNVSAVCTGARDTSRPAHAAQPERELHGFGRFDETPTGVRFLYDRDHIGKGGGLLPGGVGAWEQRQYGRDDAVFHAATTSGPPSQATTSRRGPGLRICAWLLHPAG